MRKDKVSGEWVGRLCTQKQCSFFFCAKRKKGERKEGRKIPEVPLSKWEVERRSERGLILRVSAGNRSLERRGIPLSLLHTKDTKAVVSRRGREDD